VIEASGVALNSASFTQLLTAIQELVANRNIAGQVRSLTPIGGALIREWADTVAATTGNIEFGISYNCAVDPVFGVWAGRDVADICWLERWSDIGGQKEFWYAPTGVANSVPAWTQIFAIDMVNGTVTLPTPAQFDNSNKGASTAFVKQAIGSMAGMSAYSATTTQPKTDFGKLIEVSGAAFTLTLPSVVGITPGSLIKYINQGAATVTLSPSSGSFYIPVTGTSASWSLISGQSITVIWDGANFIIVDGIGGALLSASGYQKMPSGLIIQWGAAAFTGVTSLAVTFPIAFTAGVYQITCSQSDAANVFMGRLFATTLTGFTALASAAGLNASWIAIGK
jgi:hypothetical protein